MIPNKVCPFCGNGNLITLGPIDTETLRRVQCQGCMAEAYVDYWDKRPREDAMQKIIDRLRSGKLEKFNIVEKDENTLIVRRQKRRERHLTALEAIKEKLRPPDISREKEIFDNR